MTKESVKIQYIDFIKDIKSFPAGPYKRIIKERMHTFLKKVRDEHGQEFVDEIVDKKKPQNTN